MITLGQRIRHDLDRLGDLPALSPIVAQLSVTLGRDDAGLAQVEAIILQDPVISARILSAANTAAYASLTPTTSIRGALLRLGLVRVRRLAMLESLYNAMPIRPVLQTRFWRHSLAVAHVAEAVARRLDGPRPVADPDAAFLAGLLHDIGLLVLASHYPRQHAAAMAVTDSEGTPLWEAELRLLGTDHTEVGGCLAEHWSFPGRIAAVIRFHHRVELAPPEYRVETAVVRLADAVCSGEPAWDMGEGHSVESDDPALGPLALDPESLAATLAETRAEIERAASAIEAAR